MINASKRKHLQELFEAGKAERPEAVVGVWVWRLSLAYQRRAELALKEFGITHLQFVILITCAWLNLTAEAVSQRDLVKEIGIQEAQLSFMVKALKAKKLVTQRASPIDTRIRLIEITSAGLTMLSTVLPHMRRFQSEQWPLEVQSEQLVDTIRAILSRWGE